MVSAYRRRQLLITATVLVLLILPWAGSKLWHAVMAMTKPSVSHLYGEWRVEPYEIAGLQVRLPIAQHLQLQEGHIAVDQFPLLPAQLTLEDGKLLLLLDNPQLGSIQMELTVENEDRMFYVMPFTGSKIYYQRVTMQP